MLETHGNPSHENSQPSCAKRRSQGHAAAQRRVLLDPELRLGEAFVDAALIVEEGTITDLLNLLLSQDDTQKRPVWGAILSRMRYLLRRFHQLNARKRSKRNVAHHYDLDGRLYDLFLDDDRQYSCAYFEDETYALDMAQAAKQRHIAAKLLVPTNARVLDIGSGWGGLALYLAAKYNAHVTGITLSEEQLDHAAQRAGNGGASGGKVDFQLLDYREVQGRFDRIVSVGMFEHVGVNHYAEFFRKCYELLDDDGVLLLHSIGRSDRPGIANPWIAKYIFPGGYIPAVSEVLSAIELYDERFARLWEFYLAGSEMAFRHQGMMVFQMQIAKRQNAVPNTRDYVALEEARLRAAETTT